uniref:Uncharacterized protein n=1 Tax=Lepeophtheirus salmonis TaxID=72036 RepID=A0A0K2TQE4_LEPSM
MSFWINVLFSSVRGHSYVTSYIFHIIVTPPPPPHVNLRCFVLHPLPRIPTCFCY